MLRRRRFVSSDTTTTLSQSANKQPMSTRFHQGFRSAGSTCTVWITRALPRTDSLCARAAHSSGRPSWFWTARGRARAKARKAAAANRIWPSRVLCPGSGAAGATSSNDASWSAARGGGGVTEAVQAKLDLNLPMGAAKAGVARTHLCELLDNGLNPTTTVEGRLGLFSSDGTPKAAATAGRDLDAILSDDAANASTFATGALDFAVSGLPSTGKTLLLQKADGRYDLVVSAEPDIWNEATRTAVAAPGSQVTATLGQTAGTVSVYDPLAGDAPVATAKDTKAVTATVTDHPLVIEIAGPATAPANLNLEGTANGDGLAGGAGADRLRGPGPRLARTKLGPADTGSPPASGKERARPSASRGRSARVGAIQPSAPTSRSVQQGPFLVRLRVGWHPAVGFTAASASPAVPARAPRRRRR